MKLETQYMNICYNEIDKNYIEQLVVFLENSSQEIVDFFALNNFGKKVEVTIFDDLERFRNHIKVITKSETVPNWLCGFSHNTFEGKVSDIHFIEVLSLREYVKTEGHSTHTLKDLESLILHEFVHACHKKYYKNKDCYQWLSEGLATTLSHQFDHKKSKLNKFNADLESMKFGCNNYANYYLMFVYVYEKYGKDYIMDLIDNFEFLVKETPRLYQEVSEFYNKQEN